MWRVTRNHFRIQDGCDCCGVVEAAISSAVKDRVSRWDLAKGIEIDAAGNVALLRKNYTDLSELCRSDRLAPLSPSNVEHLLTTEKVFTNNADVSVVTKIYKTFFDIVSSSVQELE